MNEEKAEKFMVSLATTKKKHLSGLIACVLAIVVDGTCERRWVCQTFQVFMQRTVLLSKGSYQAYIPLLSDQDHADTLDTSPFLDVLCDKEERWKLLESLLWLHISTASGYDSRTMFRYVAKEFGIPWKFVIQQENRIGVHLLNAAKIDSEKVNSSNSGWKWKQKAKVGLAAAAGATLLAVTGGMAAPAIGVGLSSLGGTGVIIGTAVASASGIAATTAVFGAVGAGLAGFKADRRTSGIKEFEFDEVTSGSGLNLCICISGWIDTNNESTSDFRRPWGDFREYLRAFFRSKDSEKIDQVDSIIKKFDGREEDIIKNLKRQYEIQTEQLVAFKDDDETLTSADHRAWRWKDKYPAGDQYCLRWESGALKRFGGAMKNFAASKALNFASGEIVKTTIFAALYAAVALPATVIRAADMIDGEWTIALERADEAGKLLANVLYSHTQGQRPVTLIGFSMGARVIYSCLQELSKLDKDQACGIVENAVILGGPIAANPEEWNSAREVVSGRLINGYSTNDWMLAVMYRYQGWAYKVCGVAPIESHRVENADLSSIIQGHLEYKNKIGYILDMLSLE